MPYEEFMQKLIVAKGGDYLNVKEYTMAKAFMLFTCRVCNYSWRARGTQVLQGTGCPQCSRRRTSIEKITQMINNLYKGEFTVVGSFTGLSKSITVRHTCGRVSSKYVPTFLEGRATCPCKYHDKYVARLYKRTNGKYTVLSRVDKRGDPVTVLCNDCGSKFTTDSESLIKDRGTLSLGCKRCSVIQHSLTTQQFAERVTTDTNGEYSLESEYVSANDKVIIRHNLCNKTYLVAPNNFSCGHRCIYCYGSHNSRGTVVIQDYLSLYGIRYTREKTFDGCKDKAKLKFDFYLDNGLVYDL
jgi:hypothetical protein